MSALTYLINSHVQYLSTVSDLHKCVFFLSHQLIYYLNVTPEDIKYPSVVPSSTLWC